jgi:hypothetical protein
MTIFSPTTELPLITAPLIGYILVTGIIYTIAGIPEAGFTQTFNIISTPEPGTAWLAFLGITALGVRRYWPSR